MKKIIICVILIVAVAIVLFMWHSRTFPRCCVVDENDFDLNMVNEVFKLDFESDVTIVDHSFLTLPPYDKDMPSEIEFNVILEFPSDKKDAYYNMINKKYALTEEETRESCHAILENIFSGRLISLESVFLRFDAIITAERSWFGRTETRHPIQTLVGIENGGALTTVYLHTVGHNEGDRIVFSGEQS